MVLTRGAQGENWALLNPQISAPRQPKQCAWGRGVWGHSSFKCRKVTGPTGEKVDSGALLQDPALKTGC